MKETWIFSSSNHCERNVPRRVYGHFYQKYALHEYLKIQKTSNVPKLGIILTPYLYPNFKKTKSLSDSKLCQFSRRSRNLSRKIRKIFGVFLFSTPQICSIISKMIDVPKKYTLLNFVKILSHYWKFQQTLVTTVIKCCYSP